MTPTTTVDNHLARGEVAMTNHVVRPSPDDYRDAIAWITARAHGDDDALAILAANAEPAMMMIALTDLTVLGIRAGGTNVDRWANTARGLIDQLEEQQS